MKNSFTTVAISCCLLLFLAGCDNNPVIGKWQLNEDDSAMGAGALSLMGMDTMEFTDERVFVGSNSAEVQYEIDGDRVTVIKTADGQGQTYVVSGDRMSIDQPGVGEIVYERVGGSGGETASAEATGTSMQSSSGNPMLGKWQVDCSLNDQQTLTATRGSWALGVEFIESGMTMAGNTESIPGSWDVGGSGASLTIDGETIDMEMMNGGQNARLNMPGSSETLVLKRMAGNNIEQCDSQSGMGMGPGGAEYETF